MHAYRLTQIMTMMDNKRALHFVGFRGDEFRRAERIFGPPDFIHRINDARMLGDVAENDVVVFANGSEGRLHLVAFNDSEDF